MGVNNDVILNAKYRRYTCTYAYVESIIMALKHVHINVHMQGLCSTCTNIVQIALR